MRATLPGTSLTLSSNMVTVSLQCAPTPAIDAGTDPDAAPGLDAGNNAQPGGGDEGGCCAASPTSPPPLFPLLLTAAFLLRRRRAAR